MYNLNLEHHEVIGVLNNFYLLSPRIQKILEMRLGLLDGIPHTLEETGKEFDVTRERIRQIECKALDILSNNDGTKPDNADKTFWK